MGIRLGKNVTVNEVIAYLDRKTSDLPDFDSRFIFVYEYVWNAGASWRVYDKAWSRQEVLEKWEENRRLNPALNLSKRLAYEAPDGKAYLVNLSPFGSRGAARVTFVGRESLTTNPRSGGSASDTEADEPGYVHVLGSATI